MLFDIYILKAYSIHYTYRENTNVKKISSDKINLTKTSSFLFRELQLISFTFDLRFLHEPKRKVHLS